MDPVDQERLSEALRFALAQHGDQARKGTTIPYGSHLLQVAGLVFEHGGDADMAVAALLHDVVEDCDVPLDLVHERFGAAVARIVGDCTDVLEHDTSERKSPWKERKEHAIAKLRSADPASQLVAACDKLHNLRCLVQDLRAEGVAVFERFNAGPDETLWYQHSIHDAIGAGLPVRLEREIAARLRELEDLLAS